MSATTLQPTNTLTQAGVPPAPPEPHQQAAAIALRATEGEGVPQYLKLGALRLDERNVRKDAPADAEIEQLADLIDAQGLLQNLTVVAYARPVKVKGKKGTYTHGVIAGGRRLRALLVLVKRGRLTLDEEILCTVVAEDRALAVSAAENSGRAPMSTADTIVAFADMVKAGAGVQDLAVCFGLSPLTVQRRLKLANVSPNLFGLFRQGQLTLDQLMALALTDDHATQEAAWAAAPEHDKSPRRLRALIAGDGLSPAVIRFVGLQAYEAAGGRVLRDLFAEDDEAPAYIQDARLMMQLASAKLAAVADAVRAEGVAWVEPFISWTYSEREQFTQAPSTQREATEAEAAALADLKARADTLNDNIEAWYDSEDEAGDPAKLKQWEDEAEAVADKMSAIQAGRRVLSPDVAALAGAVVYIDGRGEPMIERNLVRKGDAVAAKRAAAKAEAASADGGDAQSDAKVDQKAGVSDRLCHQLTAHRTRALQASLLDHQQAALAALAHPLLVRLVYGAGATWQSPSALQIRGEDCESHLKTWAPDLVGSRADGAMLAAIEHARGLLPADVEGLLPWLLDQSMETLVTLLTLCSALSLNAINGSGKQQTTRDLARAVQLDMADWWQATDAGYLGAVSKSMVAEAVAEAGLTEDAKGLLAMKKAEAVQRAQVLLIGKRWLPAVLR